MNELEIFERASEIDDANQREAFLAEACGDDQSLRQRLDALLRFQEEDSSFLNEPIASLTEDWQIPTAEEVGDTIGRYKLLDRIGEGGFGVVYMAEQREPVQRRVALKVIKLGMDTRQVIGRFEAERQALAMMDHPNIAKVLDGGATETGRPYFVMDLVKGVPITEFCDNNQLSVPERLRLFADVCNAVQHAHQKGIIHRDLKPSNVLVGMHDDQPVAKVIDFGVAKAMQQRLTEKTVFTRYQQIIGTLNYMSPEQASFNDLDVDTRSDIYSLGVLLYELLTGTTPLSQTSIDHAGYDEICRLIREEEAALPSLLVSQSGDALAQKLGSDSKELRRTLHGDLDWIVMKALEKNRLRRYETASALRQDIDNYLHDLPVSAGPPSATYRLSKFVKRNRLLVSTTALLSIMLVAGVVSLAIGNSILTGQKKETDNALELARANFELAGRVVRDFLTEVAQSEELLAGTPGTQQLRQRLLSMAKDYNEKIISRTDNSTKYGILAGSYFDLAIIERELGNYPEARRHLQTAKEVHEAIISQDGDNPASQLQMAKLLVILGGIQQRTATYDEAERTLTEAIDVLDKLLRKDPTNTAVRGAAIDAHTFLGGVYKRLWNHQASIREYKAAIDVANSPKKIEFIGLAETYQALGLEYRAIGQLKESLDAFNRAIEICEHQQGDSYLLASCLNNLGITYIATDELDEAVARFEQAISLTRDLARQNPLVDGYRFQIAHSQRNMGLVRIFQKRFSEAEPHFREAIELLKELTDENPTVANYPINLAHNLIDMGAIEHRKGNHDRALEHFQRSFDLNKELDVADPRVMQNYSNALGAVVPLIDDSSDAVSLSLDLIAALSRFSQLEHFVFVSLANAHGRLSTFYLSKQDMANFEKHTSEAVRHGKKLIQGVPSEIGHRLNFVMHSNNLGKRLRGKKELKQSEEIYLGAIEAAQGFDVPDAPVDACVRLGDSHLGLGLVYIEMKKFDEALGRLSQSVTLAESVVQKSPDPGFRVDLARNRGSLADCMAQQGSFDEALELIDMSIQELRAIQDEHPNQRRVQKYLGNCLFEKASLLNQRAWQLATDPDGAKRDGAQAVRNARQACELSNWENAAYLDTLAAAHAETGDFDEAVKWQERAIELAPAASELREHLGMYKQGKPFRAAPSVGE